MEKTPGAHYPPDMLKLFDRHGSLGRGLLLRGISFLFIGWFMTSWVPPFLEHSGGIDPLDMRLWYSPQEASELVSALGDGGGAYYLRMIVADFVFMGFALAGDAILLGLLLRALGWSDWPRWLLLAGIGADAIENIVTASVILGLPEELFWLGGLATLCKQFAAMVLLAVYTLGLGTCLVRRIRR